MDSRNWTYPLFAPPATRRDPSGTILDMGTPGVRTSGFLGAISGILWPIATAIRGLFACGDFRTAELTMGGHKSDVPEGMIFALLWSQGGSCALPRANAVHFLMMYSTYTPALMGCNPTAERELTEDFGGFNILDVPRGDAGQPLPPGCSKPTWALFPGKPPATCTFVLWSWACDVVCLDAKRGITFGPPGTCSTPHVGATIEFLKKDKTRYPEALKVSYDVEYFGTCCAMRPCKAEIRDIVQTPASKWPP